MPQLLKASGAALRQDPAEAWRLKFWNSQAKTSERRPPSLSFGKSEVRISGREVTLPLQSRPLT